MLFIGSTIIRTINYYVLLTFPMPGKANKTQPKSLDLKDKMERVNEGPQFNSLSTMESWVGWILGWIQPLDPHPVGLPLAIQICTSGFAGPNPSCPIGVAAARNGVRGNFPHLELSSSHLLTPADHSAGSCHFLHRLGLGCEKGLPSLATSSLFIDRL